MHVIAPRVRMTSGARNRAKTPRMPKTRSNPCSRVPNAPHHLKAMQVPQLAHDKGTKLQHRESEPNPSETHGNKTVSHSPTPRWPTSCPPPLNRSPSGRAGGPRVASSIRASPAPNQTPSKPISACLAAAVLAGSRAGPARPVATVPRLPPAQSDINRHHHIEDVACFGRQMKTTELQGTWLARGGPEC